MQKIVHNCIQVALLNGMNPLLFRNMTSITHWTSLGDELRKEAVYMVLKKG